MSFASDIVQDEQNVGRAVGAPGGICVLIRNYNRSQQNCLICGPRAVTPKGVEYV